MSLKKVEIYGFKSFADKTTINFENGITAIVGPNGCGKSNVSDAIRWVLGEQSPTVLRGKNMKDIIFSGTESRKSLSYCEVSLYFDNSNHIFPVDYVEVVISRKLYRNGESVYLLNNQESRLKVISDLLRDVGLGRDGYSIVGQGRIDSIIVSSPDNRRAIFEEAIGISKFRIKKVEAERKLQRTQENISRLNDILHELRIQLVPLLKQSEEAAKYNEISQQLKYQEINAFIYTYDNSEMLKAGIYERIDKLNEQVADAQKNLDISFAKYERCKRERDELEQNVDSLRIKQTELSVLSEKRLGEVNLNSQRLSIIREQTADLQVEIDASVAITEQLKKNISDVKNEIVSMNLHREELNKQYIITNDKLALEINKMLITQSESEVNQANIFKLLDGISDAKSVNAKLQEQKQSINTKLDSLNIQRKNILIEIKNNKSLLEELNNQFNICTSQKNKLTNSSNEITAKIDEVKAILNKAISFENSISQDIAVANTKLNTLQQFIDNYEAYGGGVKQLMQASLNNNQLSSKIIGVVAQLIKVKPQYEIAIDVALGQAMQNIVTSNEDDSKFLIQYLKTNKLGRVTFLPLASMKPRSLNDNSVLKETGCYGIASNLIEFNPKYNNVISSLLGAVIIVDNLDTAIRISRKYNYAYRIVTLDGEVIMPQGSMTGGTRKDSSGVFTYQRTINDITALIESKSKQLKDTLTHKDAFSDKLNKLESQLAVNEQEHKAILINHTALVEQIKSVNEKIEKFNNTISEIVLQEEQCNSNLILINESLVNTSTQLHTMDIKRTDIDSSINKGKSAQEALTAENKRLNEEVSGYKLKLSNLATNIASNEKNIETYQQTLDNTLSVIEDKTQRVKNNKSIIAELVNLLSVQNLEDASVTQLESVTNQIANLNERKLSLLTELEIADADRINYQSKLGELAQLVVREEGNLERIDLDISTLKERLEVEYQLNYSTAMQYKDNAFDVAGSKRAIARLSAAKNNFTNVNLKAVEDYKSVKTRYDELDSQLTDLTSACNDLDTAIDEISKQMISKFNTGFEAISQNFTQVFRELFAGGHAKLSLIKDSDKSELDYGVEIEAQPPGKKLQSISLFSGGERALIAVAILFAIIKLRPMPFCVLDEIEAALDDANCERAALYLRKFSRSTQFIVITHKKPTMVHSDVLFGVTMQEKGVSNIVSVQMHEAISHIQ